MLVKATEVSSKLGVKIKELGRIASRGETFDVTPLRFKVLSGDNRYKAVFVQKAVSKENEIDAVELYNKKENKKDNVEKSEVKEDLISIDSVDANDQNVENSLNVGQIIVEENVPAPKKRGRKKKNAKK